MSQCGVFVLPLLPWKNKQYLSFFIVADAGITFNNIKMFTVAMEMQQCVPFALLSLKR
jgi:hypothetical protein